MVVFDNLAQILREIVASRTKADDLKEWKLLGQEAKGGITVGWIEESSGGTYTRIGIYQPKTNDLKILCKLNSAVNVVQASVNSKHTLLSYVVKDKSNENDGIELYKPHLISVENKSDDGDMETADPQSLEIERRKQIMTNFLESSKEESKLLVFIHLESILMYHLKEKPGEKCEIIKVDCVTKAFTWAQWDCDIQVLYFIHFRKPLLAVENDEPGVQELSPTLSCLQFHENSPHETVLNIPLNLPYLPASIDNPVYEDDPLPLRIHDCSLDLMVVSDPSGIVCICHHYLYQPVKSPTSKSPDEKNSVHFAYSVTLLHYGVVIHNVVPGVPWSSAKTMRPIFTLLGAQYLVVYAAGIFTHLLDIGLSHEPCCHILMSGNLSLVPPSASRLVPLKGEFSDAVPNINKAELQPTVVIDLFTMDLIEFEVTVEDLKNCLTTVESLSNRLSILHYILVHSSDFECIEDALIVLLKHPTDINVPIFFQEVLVGGAYYFAQKNLPADANSLLKLLPLTCVDPLSRRETKINQITFLTSQEILWNTNKMLLSPQQRLVPFVTDIWGRLWDNLIISGEVTRFKPTQIADKLLISLGSYQPEALSRCSTPLSPGKGFVTSFLDIANVNQAVINSRKISGIELPFSEVESCTASKQEYIISVNLRELSLYLLKNCVRDSPVHVHPVATRYVAGQLEISRFLCDILRRIAGIENETEKGFILIQSLPPKQREILFTYFQRYYNAVDGLAYPLPQGFSSFFSYLGFKSLSFEYFLKYVHNNVFELQIDVMKEIMKDIEDTEEGVNEKLRLLILLPRSRAKRLLHAWPHETSLMIRAREHALNILSGVQSSRLRGLPYSRRAVQNSQGLAAFPSGDRLSPLDTFLDLLTAKAAFKFADSPCGNTNLTDSKGTIVSPNYPSAYLSKVKCEWRIHSPAESILKINIVDLDIVQDEPCSKIPCCTQQGLLVPSEGGRGSELLCGNVSTEKTIIVSQPVTIIKYFSTLTEKVGRGFEITYSIEVRLCKSHELECVNGKCVANDSFCNGIDDCGDGSDEMYCPHITHTSSLYEFYPKKIPNVENHLAPKPCSDGWEVCPLSPDHCYSPKSDLCDEEFDCPKGEDEVGCVSTCPDQIACSSGDGCYYPNQRCNMIRNCRDNSDETGCPAEPCIAMQFTCLNKACVSGSVICDGNDDCGDFSDEEDCARPSFLTAILVALICFLSILCFGLSCSYRILTTRMRAPGFVDQLEPEPMDEEFMYREPPPAYSVAVGEAQTLPYSDSEFMERYYEPNPGPPLQRPQNVPPNRRRPRGQVSSNPILGRSRPRPSAPHITQSNANMSLISEGQQPKIGRFNKNESDAERPAFDSVMELLGFPDEITITQAYIQRSSESPVNYIMESPCSSPSLSPSRESVTSSTSLEDHEELVRPPRS